MDDLARWLGAQLDEDERIARSATEGPWEAEIRYHRITKAPSGFEVHPVAEKEGNGDGGVLTEGDAAHIARHDPARVLREIGADRVLLVQYERLKYDVMPDDMTGVFALEAVIRAKAAVYADRPGYREEWAPTE